MLCEKAAKATLPAIRSIAVGILSSEYSLKQSEISKRLGIAQAAVSKYMNKDYSDRVGKTITALNSIGIDKSVKKALTKNKDVSNELMKIAVSKKVLEIKV
ncbi:MAG: hypothetical protein LVQ97_01040 [Candidatus Micrarchaeales archaeon]|jgi:predicted transcriptional regulator|nr:hypothetical protein [Candidatus Micrarchaeales archaeon]